jgi:hypothetical protein
MPALGRGGPAQARPRGLLPRGAHGTFGAKAEDGMVSLSLTEAFIREQVIALMSEN